GFLDGARGPRLSSLALLWRLASLPMATPQAFKDYIVRYRRGDRIYTTGDPGTEMYIVQSGSVNVFSEAHGRRIELATMEKGDFFGEMALIESAPHSTSAEAASDCELI